jgi:hypothetical protein
VPIYVAHYEAFISNPQLALTHLLTFLAPHGFGWSPTRVNHALATVPLPSLHSQAPLPCRPLNTTLLRSIAGHAVQQPITRGDIRQTIDTYGRLLEKLGYRLTVE